VCNQAFFTGRRIPLLFPISFKQCFYTACGSRLSPAPVPAASDPSISRCCCCRRFWRRRAAITAAPISNNADPAATPPYIPARLLRPSSGPMVDLIGFSGSAISAATKNRGLEGYLGKCYEGNESKRAREREHILKTLLGSCPSSMTVSFGTSSKQWRSVVGSHGRLRAPVIADDANSSHTTATIFFIIIVVVQLLVGGTIFLEFAGVLLD
jgi:hypothetical protein